MVNEREEIIIVVAADANNVIGNSDVNEVPWRIGDYALKQDTFWNTFQDKESFRPYDMKFFQNKTIGYDTISGRLTAESMGPYFPLLGRNNRVLSNNSNNDPRWTPGEHIIENPTNKQGSRYFVHTNMDLALDAAFSNNDKIAIIGGGGVYQEAMNKGIVDRIFLNRLNNSFKGDVFFPPIGDEFLGPAKVHLLKKPEYQKLAHSEIYIRK
jgi:dihydrofolate reductase